MAGLAEKVKGYIRLIRLHSIIASGLAPILGACATFAVMKDGWMVSQEELILLGNLFLVGIMVHIFGQTLNEYADLKIDKENPELAGKPLVSGVISKGEAIAVMVVSFVLIFVVAIPLYTMISFIVLVLVGVCGIAYDLLSKKFVHSPILIAGWAFFLGLFGGVAAGEYGNLTDVPMLVYIICLLGALQMWTNTAILGHIKDLKNDAECGLRTFAIELGVRVDDRKDPPGLHIPINFRVMTILIQVLNLALAFIPIVFFSAFYKGTDLFTTIIVFLGLVLLSIFAMLAQVNTMWHKTFERGKLMQLMSVREVAVYFLVIVLVYPMVGPVLALVFIFLPLVWFAAVNWLFTGKVFQPAI
jgi:4-hydroxybenzoate polyprenyltransferase